MSGSTYLYTELGPKEIRVFNLLPAASQDAPLECEVFIRTRDENLRYEAVSYVWGTVEGPFTQLKVRSTPENRYNANRHFFIGSTLAGALRRKFDLHLQAEAFSSHKYPLATSLQRLMRRRVQISSGTTATLDRYDMHQSKQPC